jgi:hypothetical protein
LATSAALAPILAAVSMRFVSRAISACCDACRCSTSASKATAGFVPNVRIKAILREATAKALTTVWVGLWTP